MRLSTHMTTVRRVLVLGCLCAAPLAGFACTGAEESTAPAAPTSNGGQDAATPAGEPAAVTSVDTGAHEVAMGFLEAYGAFDVERAITYLADDADVSGMIRSVGSVGAQSELGTREGFRLLVSFLRAEGYKQMLHGCEELGSSDFGTNLHCTFDFHAIRSDEIGLGPFSGSSFLLTVRDGKIVEASKSWAIGEFSPQMWEPFARWVSTAHPADANVMYTGGLTGARLTERSIRLWEQRSREYAHVKIPGRVKTAERFMEARNAYDAEKAMSLLSSGAVWAQLLFDNALHPNMPAVALNQDQLALALEAERLYGARYEPFDCRHSGTAQVTCSYRMDSRLRQIEGYPPIESSFELGFQEGRIDRLSFPWLNISWDPGGMHPAEFTGFVRWLEDHHPRAGVGWPPPRLQHPRVFRTWGQEWILILTRKSIDLLADYLEAYERSVTG